jgi:hypothetical protein
VRLHELAHSRTGDKGDVSNISIIAYEPADYAFLRQEVTAERVRAQLAGIVRGEILRYELPALGALNFVLHGALGGGVTRSLALDSHGKSLSGLLLGMSVDYPAVSIVRR